jgi:Sushi repeat (SCR repeat)
MEFYFPPPFSHGPAVCRDPAPIDYGFPQYIDDDTFIYRCNEGFELVGNGQIKCNTNTGQWDPLPKCRCMAPPTLENAIAVQRDDTFIQHTCNEDFKMTGNASISCDESGRWTTRPNCKFL